MRHLLIRCVIVFFGLVLMASWLPAQQLNMGQLAQSAYDKHAYAEGAPLFLLAAQREPGAAAGHLYNAACCYALAGQKDLAFYSLLVAVNKGWRNKQHTENDEDLASLRSDPRWKDVLGAFEQTSDVTDNRDAIINDLNNLAAFAYQYRVRPSSMGGGQGSYAGFAIASKLSTNANASYEILSVGPNEVRFRATSAKGDGTVESSIDQNGRLSGWKYTGKFAEPPKARDAGSAIRSNRDALINQINNIAAQAYQYRIRPTSMGGGQGAYTGFQLPVRMSANEDGTFSVKDVEANGLKIEAVSKKVNGSITTILDGDGRLSFWTYYGELQ